MIDKSRLPLALITWRFSTVVLTATALAGLNNRDRISNEGRLDRV